MIIHQENHLMPCVTVFGLLRFLGMVLITLVVLSGVWVKSGIAENRPRDPSLVALKDQSPANSSASPAGAHVHGTFTVMVDPALKPYWVDFIQGFHHLHPHYKVILQEVSSNVPNSEIDGFLKDLPKVRKGNGYNKGPFGSNTIKLVALRRPLSTPEIESCISRFGYPPVSLTIGKEAVVLYVNRANPVQNVTLDQVQAMYGQIMGAGKLNAVTEWGDVGGKGSWVHFPVHLYGLIPPSQKTRSLFRETVLQGGPLKSTMTDLSGPASLVLAVANDPFGIGFGPMGYAIPQVRVLPISKSPGLPAIAPSEPTITNGTYPLSRPFYLHVNKKPNQELDSPLEDFLRYLHSTPAQTALASRGAFALETFEVARNFQLLQLTPDTVPVNVGGQSPRQLETRSR